MSASVISPHCCHVQTPYKKFCPTPTQRVADPAPQRPADRHRARRHIGSRPHLVLAIDAPLAHRPVRAKEQQMPQATHSRTSTLSASSPASRRSARRISGRSDLADWLATTRPPNRPAMAAAPPIAAPITVCQIADIGRNGSGPLVSRQPGHCGCSAYRPPPTLGRMAQEPETSDEPS